MLASFESVDIPSKHIFVSSTSPSSALTRFRSLIAQVHSIEVRSQVLSVTLLRVIHTVLTQRIRMPLSPSLELFATFVLRSRFILRPNIVSSRVFSTCILNTHIALFSSCAARCVCSRRRVSSLAQGTRPSRSTTRCAFVFC